MTSHEQSQATGTVERELEGRRAIVTGGSRGIGAAIARRLAAAGADVVAVARTAPADTADPAEVRFVAGDVSSADGVARIADAALEQLGGVDIIVNNAGASSLHPNSLAIPDDRWQADLDINLLAAVRLNATLVPQMLERGSGAIIHISSSAAYSLPGGVLHYGVSKAALIAYSKGLATELAPKGVRVNTITPGSVATPGGDRARGQIAAALGAPPEALLANIPVGRVGHVDEIAEAVAYLVSDRAGFFVGANLVIDGGELQRT
jgi:NAD(P)-dependent dehydrogenase (short-subunit alcohol dehydrogenase family)